jgi:DNA-binding transcriptional regulator PaaX
MRLNVELVLAYLMWGVETFSRRDCGLILGGLRVCDSERRLTHLLGRLEQQRLVERRGRGAHARFTITAAGRQRIAVTEPTPHWNQPWDGKWRVFNYDLPESRRTERMLLWRALRERKLGLLQRSMWVWPHEVEPMLREIIRAQGIPECFCGFCAETLFLCSNAEVVNVAWDWEEIRRRHQTYQQHPSATVDALKRADDLPALARVARIEREAYQYAFVLDPLLPRSLWPSPYAGPRLEARHQEFLAALSRRTRDLAS